MNHPICIFEDDKCRNLHPLSLTRPVYDLRCGILTLREKIVRQYPNHRVVLFCRQYLVELVELENDEPTNRVESDTCLFINGRLVADAEAIKSIDSNQESIFVKDGNIVAAFLKGSNKDRFIDYLKSGSEIGTLAEVNRRELDHANLINYPWDLIHQNATEIVRDFHSLNRAGIIAGEVSDRAVLVNKGEIHIGENSVVKPGAVLDADSGPIYIGENVTIMHNAVIEGPAFVGDGSSIKIGAKIYEGTSIGEVCKVGGEVEESIIHSHSNKQHDGFLGHAYLGQWVNLGADTNNSDLKNNYGNVKVHVNGDLVDSGSMFVGLFMGDHSKAGINTMFNTGTSVGTMCNVFGSGFPPKYIPSFSWGGAEKMVEHDLSKAIETGRQVMARRKKKLTTEHEKVFRYLFERTREHRAEYHK